MRTAQEVADSVTTDDDECQNTYAREAVESRDAEIAKELREMLCVALNTPYCHKTEQELRDCLGILVSKCDALATTLEGEDET